MYWEERIDWIRKEYSLGCTDFKVPFTDWVTVTQKIESRFIIKQNTNQHFNFWPDNLKGDKVQIATNQHHTQLFDYFLQPDSRYWLVLAGSPSGKYLLYDCTRKACEILLAYQPNRDFFLIDKKYSWLLYFEKGEDFRTRKLVVIGEEMQTQALHVRQ